MDVSLRKYDSGHVMVFFMVKSVHSFDDLIIGQTFALFFSFILNAIFRLLRGNR
ncbi:MAG: hypothetical protein ABF868_03240 [Sporolactobacillus sp.]